MRLLLPLTSGWSIGPITKEGQMVIKSKLCSLAYVHAAFSARTWTAGTIPAGVGEAQCGVRDEECIVVSRRVGFDLEACLCLPAEVLVCPGIFINYCSRRTVGVDRNSGSRGDVCVRITCNDQLLLPEASPAFLVEDSS